MKLGYLLRAFPVRSETFVTNEIRKLEELGHTITLASIYRSGAGDVLASSDLAERTLYWFDIDKRSLPWILAGNCHLFRLAPRKYIRVLRRWMSMNADIRRLIKMAAMANYFISRRVSHIHTHFAWEQIDFLRFIKDITGIPYSITLHAADIYMEQHNIVDAISESAFAITISEYNRQYLISECGVPEEKVKVIHCGVDINEFAGGQKKTNNPPLILSIGRMVEKKGFDILLQSFKKLKDRDVSFQAKIIGDGPLMPELTALKDNLDLSNQIHFTGPLEPKEVKKYLSECDIFALACRQATTGDIDGIPVVLMEAMAAGLPVVSTHLSGIPELVKDNCGILVKPDNVDEFANALERIILEPDLASNIGRSGRTQVEKHFSIQGQVAGLVNLIKERI